MLGNKIDKKKKAELMKKLEKQCPKTCERELKKISVIAKDPAFAQLVGKFEKIEKKKPKRTVKKGAGGGYKSEIRKAPMNSSRRRRR